MSSISSIIKTVRHTFPTGDEMFDNHVVQTGKDNVLAMIKRFRPDYVYLYGDRISEGMQDEIEVAHQEGIPVLPMSIKTAEQYGQY